MHFNKVAFPHLLLQLLKIIVVFIPAFWLRWLYISSDNGLFIDEYFSLWNGRRTWETGLPLMPGGAFEIRGILHSYLLVPFVGWGESTPLLSRFASLILGLGCILLVWRLGRIAWNERVGWGAAVVFVFLPEAIEASGRVRFYAPLLLLTLLTLWAAYHLLQEHQERFNALFFALCFALALLALEEVIVLFPFIILGVLLWRGWRFLLQPQAQIAFGLGVLAIVVRMGLEFGGGAAYSDLLEADKSYFTFDFQWAEAWDTYRVLLLGGIRTLISALAAGALGIACVQLLRRRGQVSQLSRFDQATLFFALQFLGVLFILLFIAGWREERYLWLVQPIWLLLAVAGAVRLIEWVVAPIAYRWAITLILSGVLVIGLREETWTTIQIQPEGFSDAFRYVAEQMQPGDAVLSSLPTMCPILIQRPCDYYARERGYEDYVVIRDDRAYDRWTDVPLLNSDDQLREVIQAKPRVWLISDGRSFGERYREDFFSVLVAQANLVYESRGVRVVLAEGLQAEPSYQIGAEYKPRLELGPYELEGWERTSALPGQPLEILLQWWQVRFAPVQINTSVHLVAADSQRITQADGPPAKGIIATTDNTRALLPDPKTLLLPPDLAEGRYRLELIAYDTATQVPVQPAFPFAWFRIGDPPTVTTLPMPIEWQEGITLFGMDALSPTLEPNTTLPIRLGWRTNAAVPRDYTGFVQLLAPDGSLIAQSDRPPENGFYPTSAWAIDDPVVETHTLTLPDTLPAGTYRLLIGWYHLESGERLRLTDGSDAYQLTVDN